MLGTDEKTGYHYVRIGIDQPRQRRGPRRRGDLRDVRRHPRDGKEIRPGAWGWADDLAWNWKCQADIPIVCVSGCREPEDFMVVLLDCSHGGRTSSR